MFHQFNKTGVFCYKTENNQIGTIIVEPKKNIHSFPVFGDQLSKLKWNKYRQKTDSYSSF